MNMLCREPRFVYNPGGSSKEALLSHLSHSLLCSVVVLLAQDLSVSTERVEVLKASLPTFI